MTKEELEALLETEEGKALLSEVAAGMGLGDTSALKLKNSQIISEKRKLQEKLKSFEGLDVQKYQEMLEKMEEMELDSELDDLDPKPDPQQKQSSNDKALLLAQRRYERELKKIQTELENAKNENTLLTNELTADKIKAGIYQQFSDNRVSEKHQKVLYAAHRGRATIQKSEDGKSYQVMMKDDEGLELPINEFYSAWSATDEAKEYIKAPEMNGGGANGANGRQGNEPPQGLFDGMFKN